MNFSHFFIKRPVFAGVLVRRSSCSSGLIAMPQLPISEYPEVVPPTVVVRATYPGANPQDDRRNRRRAARAGDQRRRGLALHVLAGDERRRDDADRHVQARHRRRQGAGAGAEPRRAGAAEAARGSAAPRRHDEQAIARPDDGRALFSPDDRYDRLYLAQLRRAAGQGRARAPPRRRRRAAVRLRRLRDARLARPRQGRRARPDRERRRRRDPRAERAGRGRRLGSAARSRPPANAGRISRSQINAKGRLVDEEEFGNIIVKTGSDGENTRLRDVARIELGADNYALRSLLDNKTAVAMPIFQRPGSNAIAISDAVRATMAELKKNFPEGLDYNDRLRPDGVRARLDRGRRAHAARGDPAGRARRHPVPADLARIDHPAARRAGFAGRHVRRDASRSGSRINALSLFGLVLAIGIVVDDAIVVVENVERNIALGLSPDRRRPSRR